MIGLTCLKVCECILYHYWYILNINFRFDPKACTGCHNLMQKAMSFNGIIIVLFQKKLL